MLFAYQRRRDRRRPALSAWRPRTWAASRSSRSSGSGRSTRIDPGERLTHTGVLARLGPQTDGLVTWRDLTALPCSHPHCCSIGYLLQADDGRWRSLAAIVGHDRLKSHLDLVSNRIIDPDLSAQLRQMVKQSFLGLFSESSSLAQPGMGELFRNVCEACDLGLSNLVRLAGEALRGKQEGLRELLGRRVKRITVKPFMDIHTMLEERLVQCCVHVGTIRQRPATSACRSAPPRPGRPSPRPSWRSGWGSFRKAPRDEHHPPKSRRPRNAPRPARPARPRPPWWPRPPNRAPSRRRRSPTRSTSASTPPSPCWPGSSPRRPVLAFFAARALLAYRRAWRAGLRRSDCILRDLRLVMLYLGILAAAGAGWTGWTLWVLWRRFGLA